eukprot:Colp12_sorted_trinity150504_noHs@32799
MEGATEPKKRGRSASFAKWVQSPLLKEKYNGLKNSGSHEDFTVLQNEGKVFIVKYIGETICDAWTGQDAADRAARQILLRHSTKSKLPKLELTINIDGLKVYSPEAKATLFSYPLHKISQFCSTHDKYEGKEVCSYIASRQGEEKALPVLHLFFCKQPHELSRATDQSFALAYKRHVDQKGLQPKGFALDPSSAPAEEGGPAATDFPQQFAPQQQIQTTQYSSPQPQPAYHQGQGQRRPSQLGQQNPFAQPQTSPFADDFAQLSLRNQ